MRVSLPSRVVAWLAVVVIAVIPFVSAKAAPDLEQSVVEAVERYLQVRATAMVHGVGVLDGLYGDTPEGVAAREKSESWFKRDLIGSEQSGYRYLAAEVTVDVLAVSISGNRAQVSAIEHGTLTWAYLTAPADLMETKYANVEHSIGLIRVGEDWLVVEDDFPNMYEKNAHPASGARSEGTGQPDVADVQKEDSVLGFYVYYNRTGARDYADYWWDKRNDWYRDFSSGEDYGGDCANFVSQSMYEGGGAPKDYTEPHLWWYNHNGTTDDWDDTWKSPWTVAQDQAYNISRNPDNGPTGNYVSSASQLALGDPIYYDFTGDGLMDHSAIVVAFDAYGEPLVNYHTWDTYHRHWNLGAYTTLFLHIDDAFWIN